MPGRHFPKELVGFVAKTGFITKETWVDFFFSGGSVRWKNSLWASFKDRRYFLPYRTKRLKDIYVLNCLNREVLGFLPERAVRPPPAAQIDHDEILARGVLMAVKVNLLKTWMTEAELKSFAKDSFRIESQGRILKYPDAVVSIGGPHRERKLAIEIEVTQKNKQRYIQILSAYGSMRGLDGVFFVTDSPAIWQMILDTAKQVYFPFEKIKLGLIDLTNWQHATWAQVVDSPNCSYST